MKNANAASVLCHPLIQVVKDSLSPKIRFVLKLDLKLLTLFTSWRTAEAGSYCQDPLRAKPMLVDRKWPGEEKQALDWRSDKMKYFDWLSSELVSEINFSVKLSYSTIVMGKVRE